MLKPQVAMKALEKLTETKREIGGSNLPDDTILRVSSSLNFLADLISKRWEVGETHEKSEDLWDDLVEYINHPF